MFVKILSPLAFDDGDPSLGGDKVNVGGMTLIYCRCHGDGSALSGMSVPKVAAWYRSQGY